MAREYAPIFLDWPTVTRELNAQEKGRLIDAIVAYQAGGDWQEQIKGNERYVFPGYQVRIDRWNEVSATRAKASKGEQTETNANKPEQTSTKQNKTPKDKDKVEVEVKVKDDNDGNSECAWVTDSEIAESLARDRQIEDASHRWGLPCNEGHMIQARDWAREYTLEWLLRAIETAGGGKEQTWRYVHGILRSWKENGGPDAPRKQQASPAKTVSAQQYQQREYTEDQLNEISGDLLAEARALRGTA